MPAASSTQLRSGWVSSNMLMALGPGLCAPTRMNSTCKMAYLRFENTTVVISRDSRACVQSAWTVYMPLPSASSAITLRSGQATAAPVANGSPIPMAPPVRSNHSWGAAFAVNVGMANPEVAASLITTVLSGICAAILRAMVSGVSGPLGKPISDLS